MRLWKSALWLILVCAASASAAIGQPSGDQLMTFNEAAHKVCETVKQAHGKKTSAQLGAEVQAKAGGLFGKIFDVGVGTKGAISREEFEGLSREATAALLEGDRQCRERLVKQLIGMWNAPAQLQPTPQQQSTPKQQSTPMDPRQSAVDSEPSPRPYLTSRDISGRYEGNIGADVPNPAGGITRAYTPAELEIRMSSEGNFEGTFNARGNRKIPVRGKVSGDDVAIEGPIPNDTETITLEGKIVGNSIKGTYQFVGPKSTQALEDIRTHGWPEPPPGNFAFYR